MGTICLMVIILFFAMLGVVQLVNSVGRWLSGSGTLEGCTMVAEPGEDAEYTESMLLCARDVVSSNPHMRGISLVVVCPGDSPSREVAERFCGDYDIPLLDSWPQIEP